MNNFLRLFGQYADDIDITCKNTKQNISEIHKTLADFAKCTGLKDNYDKTTLYCIGKYNEAIPIEYTKGMKVVTSSINVLGVNITADLEKLLRENYDPLYEKCKAILNSWKSRQLSLYGKIITINTLVASQFVYKMNVLPSISDQFIKKMEKLCEEFIWNGRRPKIPLKKLQNTKELGGLNLVNLRTKDNSLKVVWIKYLQNEPFLAEMVYQALSSELREKIWDCNISQLDVKKCFTNGFWKDVLNAWSLYNFDENLEIKNDQILWYNTLIRINNMPVFWKKPFESGLLKVSQLYKNSNFIEQDEATQRYQLSVLQYNALKCSIPKNWKNINVNEVISVSKHENFCKMIKPTSFYYKTMIQQPDLMYNTYIRWIFRLKIDIKYQEFLKLFRNIYRITNHSKLRSIQIRIFHLSLVLNSHLKQWGIKETENCTFCDEGVETIEHLFFYCKYAQTIISKVKDIVDILQKFTEEPCITIQSMLFNTVHKSPGHLINFIILAFKSYMYTQRCLGNTPSLQAFKKFIINCKNCKLYNAKKNKNCKIFYKKWYGINQKKQDQNSRENENESFNEIIQEYNYNILVCDV